MNNCWHCGQDYEPTQVHLCTHPLTEEKYGKSFSEEAEALGRSFSEEVQERMDKAFLDALRSPMTATTLPTDSAERKEIPLFRGVMRYFPAALAGVARVSKAGNDKHNGKDSPLQHTRGLSTDHADCILRHLMTWRISRSIQPRACPRCSA